MSLGSVIGAATSGGLSGLTITTLIIAAVASLGAAGTAGAALVQAHDSSVAAQQAADAARDAAGIAAAALKETTRLAADLAEGSELKRWQRDRLLPLVSEAMELSTNARWSLLMHLDQFGQELDLTDEEIKSRVEPDLNKVLMVTRKIAVVGGFDEDGVQLREACKHLVDVQRHLFNMPAHVRTQELGSEIVHAEHELEIAASKVLGFQVADERNDG